MKNVLGQFLLLLVPLAVLTVFGIPVWMESQSYQKPRQYTHYIQIGEFGTCSGVAVAKQLVLTANHCIEGVGGSVEIKVSGKLAKVVKTSPMNDIALLWAEEIDCPCAPLASESPEIDAKVVAVGWPLGRGEMATEGRMHSLVEVPEQGYKLLTDTPLVFGNSGGGLYEFKLGQWRLVGITVAVSGASVGYIGIPVWHMALSTPIEVIRHFLYRT